MEQDIAAIEEQLQLRGQGISQSKCIDDSNIGGGTDIDGNSNVGGTGTNGDNGNAGNCTTGMQQQISYMIRRSNIFSIIRSNFLIKGDFSN